MIKRVLYFGNPAYLSLKLSQLEIKLPDKDPSDKPVVRTIPIEDIGVIVLDNRQITITSGVIDQLMAYNVALVTCDSKSLPTGLLLPLCGNSIQNERFREQIGASLPLKKQLWQQVVESKIRNQAAALEYANGNEAANMLIWSKQVKSGDSENMEGRAAAYYWKNFFPDMDDFTRERDAADSANAMLNYGYAILRAIVARALVCSGLLPTLGIHHHNRYNAYCLADDIMEPYRPYVDILVLDIIRRLGPSVKLTKEIKSELLGIPVIDVNINDHRSPLMVAVAATVSSLRHCFSGESKKLILPEL